VDPEPFLGARATDAPLPWDHLGCGVTRRHLLGERERALAEKATPDCRYGDCVRCGACPELCGVEDPDLEGVRPRLNRSEPEWKASLETGDAAAPQVEPPQAGPPQAREELTRRVSHYRVWFTKTGPAAFLSQLELASVLERALRRSGLKPSFSAGFHPMPLITFGWALPVGVESREEWFALFLREPALARTVADRLGAALPEGLKILRADPLGMGKKVAQPVAEEFTLAYHLPEAEAARRLDEWRAFLSAEHFPWYSVTKRGARTMDIRPLVTSLSERSPTDLAIVFSWRDNRYASPLKLVGAVNEGLSLKDFTLVKTRQIFEGPDAPAERP